MFIYNITPHTTPGYAPFELVFGYQATLLSAPIKSPNPTYCYDDYAKKLKERLQATNQISREHIIKVKQIVKNNNTIKILSHSN